MFRTLRRRFFPNPLDSMLKRLKKRGGKKILLQWNRGLGDIALGLFAIIHRIRNFIPDAEITVLTRPNLRDGFSLLKGVGILIDPAMERGKKKKIKNSSSFDLVIEEPNPTEWVSWQRGVLTPRLSWDSSFDSLWTSFDLPEGYTYIGVQAVIETTYGSWRNWPFSYWEELFSRLEQMPNVKVILFGSEDRSCFSAKNIIDLRGKTTLFEMLSIIRHRCRHMVLPDSGILSMVYYLDLSFPIHLVSLWADPNHGILKQAVDSPNRELIHHPLIGTNRDLSTVSVGAVLNKLFPPRPVCSLPSPPSSGELKRAGAIVLAGGQGSRLGWAGPKGTFPIRGRSLFEWIIEKAPLENFPIAVMTSPQNHEATVFFFEQKGFFNREIYFFPQEELPFLDEKKRELKVLAPSGNGSVFRSFVRSGLGELFQKKGIDVVSVVPVDNPLADMADHLLIDYTRQTLSDAVIKCISAEKSMGALVEREGKMEIVEYFDLDPHIAYHYSYTGMSAFSLPFFLKMGEKALPYHLVKKQILNLYAAPWRIKYFGWKREQFIFDVLPFGKVSALCYPKESCYAPVKSRDSVKRDP